MADLKNLGYDDVYTMLELFTRGLKEDEGLL